MAKNSTQTSTSSREIEFNFIIYNERINDWPNKTVSHMHKGNGANDIWKKKFNWANFEFYSQY